MAFPRFLHVPRLFALLSSSCGDAFEAVQSDLAAAAGAAVRLAELPSATALTICCSTLSTISCPCPFVGHSSDHPSRRTALPMQACPCRPAPAPPEHHSFPRFLVLCFASAVSIVRPCSFSARNPSTRVHVRSSRWVVAKLSGLLEPCDQPFEGTLQLHLNWVMPADT